LNLDPAADYSADLFLLRPDGTGGTNLFAVTPNVANAQELT
jgi:hypothetical protein